MSARPAVPTDPGAYAPADVRLVVADMDGTLLDDRKRFPGGLWRMLDQLDARGVTFAPASGRQVWTLLDMFPDRPGMTVIGENGAIVMRDGAEISSSPLDLPTLREAVRLVRAATGPGGVNGGLVMCGKRSAYVERVDEPFVAGVVPYYHRTRQVDSQLDVLDAIEAGELDDAIVKLAVHSLDPVGPLAEATLARFRSTHQYAVSGANWADLQDPRGRQGPRRARPPGRPRRDPGADGGVRGLPQRPVNAGGGGSFLRCGERRSRCRARRPFRGPVQQRGRRCFRGRAPVLPLRGY